MMMLIIWQFFKPPDVLFSFWLFWLFWLFGSFDSFDSFNCFDSFDSPVHNNIIMKQYNDPQWRAIDGLDAESTREEIINCNFCFLNIKNQNITAFLKTKTKNTIWSFRDFLVVLLTVLVLEAPKNANIENFNFLAQDKNKRIRSKSHLCQNVKLKKKLKMTNQTFV